MAKKDLNQNAFFILEQVTGENPIERTKNEAAVALGRLGGLKGGKARADSLTPERRKEIAQAAVAKRWTIPPPLPVNNIVLTIIENNTALYDTVVNDIQFNRRFDRKIPSSFNYNFHIDLFLKLINADNEVIFNIESSQDFLFERWTYSQEGQQAIKNVIALATKEFHGSIKGIISYPKLGYIIDDYFADFLVLLSNSTLDKI